jgi:hypothetical protein
MSNRFKVPAFRLLTTERRSFPVAAANANAQLDAPIANASGLLSGKASFCCAHDNLAVDAA